MLTIGWGFAKSASARRSFQTRHHPARDKQDRQNFPMSIRIIFTHEKAGCLLLSIKERLMTSEM